MTEFLQSLTPEFFNVVIAIVILIGSIWAAIRLYQDFTRPLPDERPMPPPQKDAKP